MSLRRKSREFALQMLFQWDLHPQEPAQMEGNFWKNARAEKKTREFANQLFEGAAASAKTLDAMIEQHAKNWKLERLAAIDRNILRLGIYELQQGDVPAKVVINEAVELAKKFSTEEAAPFINGILDAVAKTIDKK